MARMRAGGATVDILVSSAPSAGSGSERDGIPRSSTCSHSPSAAVDALPQSPAALSITSPQHSSSSSSQMSSLFAFDQTFWSMCELRVLTEAAPSAASSEAAAVVALTLCSIKSTWEASAAAAAAAAEAAEAAAKFASAAAEAAASRRSQKLRLPRCTGAS